jgi:hypothetical protein
MLLARREDFEPASAEERAAALYGWDPSVQPMYTQPEVFQARINQLIGRFAPNGQKLAIWGCGFGYLVNLAVSAGYDAYGFDASSYAINRGKALLPGIAARLFVRNALVSGDMTPARRDAGLPGAQRFPLLITEDMLTCLTDAEISTALTNLRGISSSNLLHMVWPLDPLSPSQDPRCNWKSIPAWVARLAPPDVVYDAVTNRVWNATGEI